MPQEEDPNVIVVSGLSGKCANSNNIHELRDAIYNKKDMITSENNRWPRTPEVPERTGKIPNVDKFDNGFFDIPDKQVDWMDPINRMVLEVVFEALLDAGIGPKEIEGTRTGIYMGSCYSESEMNCYSDTPRETYSLKGSMKAALTTRIGHFLKIDGPSYICDSACSSSLFALHHAFMDLQKGKCDYAIVCGSNIILTPNLSQQFSRLGVLSRDGTCKSFDASADGYARSDGLICVILQKMSTAKRCYAEMVHCMTNCDGFKEMGITFPSSKAQKVLLEDFYEECKIPTENIGYVEAHGTGTKVGDPEELETIEKIFCKNRQEPLMIGSIKSNLGHNEGASGVNALVKVCLILESGLIPPNINFKTPKPSVEGLMNGNLKVVTEVTPLPENKPYIAISNFGFGGANGHVLLKKPSVKVAKIEQKSQNRLVVLSGRTKESVQVLLDDLKSRPFDEDYIRLINSVFMSGIDKHTHRGYAILDKTGIKSFEISENLDDQKTLKCFFHTFGISTIGVSIAEFPPFKDHLEKVQNIIESNKFDLKIDELMRSSFNCDPAHEIILTVIIQTGISDILKTAKIDISEYIGSGIGEISAAYADDVITLDQAIIIVHRLAKSLQNYNEIDRSMLIDELNDVCTPRKIPKKWVVQKNIQANLTSYLVEAIFTEHKPWKLDGNLLVLGRKPNQKDINNKKIICISDKDASDNLLLKTLGRLYLLGYSTYVDELYPKQFWPVPRGTPMISPLIKWNHSKSWNYVKFQTIREEQVMHKISLNHPNWQHIEGHIIDGRILFPATGYLYLAWVTYSAKVQVPICFENVKFLRACTLTKTSDLNLCVQLHRQTGNFQITEGDAIVVTGTINETVNPNDEWYDLPAISEVEPHEILYKKDIYKELGLRGYQYQGQFKEIQNLDINATVGHIKWTQWIPFIDNMLQVKILQEDTRSLYVPTKISKLIINPAKHMDLVYAKEDTEECIFPVYHYKDLDIIRSGFVEVRGLTASSIVRRKNPSPILEVNKFVPYNCKLEKHIATRVITQIALENNYSVKIKLLEVFEKVPENLESLLRLFQHSLNDQPIIQPEYHIITDREIELNEVTFSEKTLQQENMNYIIIGYNLYQNSELRQMFINSLKPGGFLISREPLNSEIRNLEDISIICEYETVDEILLLMRPKETMKKSLEPIKINTNNFDWLDDIQKARQQKQNLLLVSQNDNNNGLLGLTNCLLRESGDEKIISVLINDYPSKFNLNNEFYKSQLEKNLSVNVLKDGKWGSYRHLLIDQNNNVKSSHAFVNNTIRGDLSSLCWMQGNLSIPENNKIGDNESTVYVYASALNFRDVMVASGKITLDSISKDRKFHECLLGIEFAGRKENGQRVMGFWESGAMSNMIKVKDEFLWDVPDDWTLSEAATVPAVYATNIFGLLMRANLKVGESILIHSATGGIGLSAINIALHYKCKIFLTVGTEEKRHYILKNYPSISANHIGNSRNTSFHELILRETNGKGVDLILNSLADEKLQMSTKCLRLGGRFIEIGKFDLNNDTDLSLELANKNAEYHGVMLDNVMSAPGVLLQEIAKLLSEGIHEGFIKPIPKTTFGQDELEAAFRYMTTGKHIGKIVINIRNEEISTVTRPEVMPMEAKPRFYCNPKGSYVILGGLGGFGLELADWLAVRGARNIILVSRKGITNGYQQLRLKIWESYQCNVNISQEDVTTLEGCSNLLDTAQNMGQLCGIFNLAVVLRDAVIENQTKENFRDSFNPKAQATIYLDQLTRLRAPRMDHFVVFSSVSCGRGNAGQTNYGYSNSVMERVCERRHEDGFSGTAIQWGVIGDVGIVADYMEQNIEIVIGGTMHQRIASCLEVLDIFMLHEEPIVSSMVVAEKKSAKGDNDIVSVVCNLLQITDIKTVSPHSTFPELGMDSMMAVEIKQMLERDFDVFVSPQELRNMTFAKLNDLASGSLDVDSTEQMSIVQNLLRFIPSEDECDKLEVSMKTGSDNQTDVDTLYLIPGVEGMSTVFENMARQLKCNAICLQFAYDETSTQNTIEEMALAKFKILEKKLTEKSTCNIVCHSLGSTVALELVTLLEQHGYSANLIIIDGAPSFNRQLMSSLMDSSTDENLQVSLISNIMSGVLPMDVIEKSKEALIQATSFEERCNVAINAAPEKLEYTSGFLRKLLKSVYNRIRAEFRHDFVQRVYKSRIILCKASMMSLGHLEEDYGLRELVGEVLEVRQFDGDHISILENKDLIKLIEEVVKH